MFFAVGLCRQTFDKIIFKKKPRERWQVKDASWDHSLKVTRKVQCCDVPGKLIMDEIVRRSQKVSFKAESCQMSEVLQRSRGQKMYSVVPQVKGAKCGRDASPTELGD